MDDNEVKMQIVALFRANVYGKTPNLDGTNSRHDGKEGQWLEHQFGIHSNALNAPDILGYELKNQTSSGKTTFGDWSANEYIYDSAEFSDIFNRSENIENRDRFIEIFGKPNEKKGGRYSWSGEPCPKISGFNSFGQRLLIVENNDIIVEYSYSEDKRPDKCLIVPECMQLDHLVIARWYGNSTPFGKKGKCLKAKLEDKFNGKGWFTCKKNAAGVYNMICFGRPMTFDHWIELVKQGIVYFDSGMYQGNPRPYSQWRANNDYWESLIVERIK